MAILPPGSTAPRPPAEVQELPRMADPALHKTSYERLEDARKAAKRHDGYDSKVVRQIMMRRCREATKLTPYPEQLDLAECLLLGLDCTAIAPTGWGKTLPFALPFFSGLFKKKLIIIQSPLNILEEDQAARFRKMGLKAIAWNSDTYTDKVHKSRQSR